MRAGRLHIAAFGTGAVPLAVNCAGFVPFAIMGGDDGILGYEMEVITYPGSGIVTPARPEGSQLAFTSPTSNSGFKVPSVLLRGKYGLEPGRDYTAVFAGRHENSVLGVASKDYDAAAIANEVMHRMMARGVVKKEQIVTVYRSDRFPTAGFGLAHNLDPQTRQQDPRGVLQLPVGWERARERVRAAARVAVHADQLPGRLGARAQDRRGDQRPLRLPVSRQGVIASWSSRGQWRAPAVRPTRASSIP